MKKKLYTTFTLCLAFILVGFIPVVKAQYTSIPDANFEQKLIDLGVDTEGTLDGQVLTADISGLWSLNVSNSSISDLTGIEDFTTLATLEVNDNSLTSLNVTTLSNLEYLNCFNNMLSTLNVAGLANLISLECYNNSISSLDLASSIAMTNLVCATNSLTALDVTSNIALVNLICYTNQIIYLDLNNNVALTKVYAYGNNLGGNGDNESFKIKNGNNTNISTADFQLQWNWNVLCMEVDDKAWSDMNWTNISLPHMTFSEDCSILPVELINFTSKSLGAKIQLTWSTSSEINNEGFEIEKSQDGKDWTKFGWVSGNRNSTEIKNYTFEDNQPLDGMNYYRLKQVDLDGQYEYSDVINTNIEHEQKINLYPNPTDGIIYLTTDQTIINVSITDVVGRKMITTNFQNDKIDLTRLSPGIYNVKIETEFEIITKRIIRE